MDESERDMDPVTREKAHKAFRRAVGLARTQTAFAARIGATQQNISKLVRARRLLSRDLAIATEHEFGVHRCELRPDLFPPEEYQSPGTRPDEAPAAERLTAAGVDQPSTDPAIASPGAPGDTPAAAPLSPEAAAGVDAPKDRCS